MVVMVWCGCEFICKRLFRSGIVLGLGGRFIGVWKCVIRKIEFSNVINIEYVVNIKWLFWIYLVMSGIRSFGLRMFII